MLRIKKNLILVVIILVAAIVRLWKVGIIPPGLFGDEVDTGYQAYSILKTGRDYFGNFLPVHFQSFGDWRVPLYIYLDSLFVAFLGLNELAVRLPSAILGILGVLATYFLVKKITSRVGIALLAAFLLAISPWHIQLSRIGLEAIFLPVLFPLGIIAFLKAVEVKKGYKWFMVSGFILGLSVYTYNTPKLFLPLLVLSLIFIWRKELLANRKKAIFFLAALLVILIPLGVDFIKGSSQARFLSISIFSDSQVSEKVRLAREGCDYQGIVVRLLHNKVTVWTDTFVKNYLSSVSTDFLFAKGDLNPRHAVGGRGELYLFELPFLILGLGIVFLKAFKDKRKVFQLILAWLVLSPIPAALTQNGGTHAIRLFLFIPWFQIVTALGIWAVWEYIHSRRVKISLIALLSFIICLSVFSYTHDYFVHYPKISGRWWNYGYREIFDYVNINQCKYDKIYISSSWEPPIVYVMFYSRYPVRNAQKELTIHSNKIGKYNFSAPKLSSLLKEGSELKTLYVLAPGELEFINYHNLGTTNDSSIKFIKEIKAPDQSIAFVVFSSSDVE